MSAVKKSQGEGKKGQEKYMWLGFGDYTAGGLQGPINPGNVRADPSIFDMLFKIFGLKDKPKKSTEKNADDVRDPSW